MYKIITTEIFIKNYKQKYPNSNSIFDRIKYFSSKEKIEIGCDHGYWNILPSDFINGKCSCKECDVNDIEISYHYYMTKDLPKDATE